MLDHPLVSPVVAQSWVGSPPMWMAVGGGERLADGPKFLAQNAAGQGVTVVWEEYEAMPHLWPLLFKSWPQNQRCWEGWSRACSQFANGVSVAAKGQNTEVESLRSYHFDVLNLTPLSMHDIQRCLRDHRKTIEPFKGSKKAML